MYTLLLFFSLCYLVPVSYSTIFDKIDIGILNSKNIFYILLFVISFLIVDIVVQIYQFFNKKRQLKIDAINKKTESEKKKLKRVKIIRELDNPEKNILFLFIESNTKTRSLEINDPYVRVLTSKEIIVNCGSLGYMNMYAYHLSPIYIDAINQVYREEINLDN